MFGVSDYGAFCLAVFVFLLVPGPGNLALITSTAKGGLRGGFAATAGLLAGDQVLLWMAVAGVAAVLQAMPGVFKAVQWVGAAYLFYLGVRMLLAKQGGGPVFHMEPRRFFQQSLAITLLNPKAIVFYMAFFPLFVNPATHLGALSFAAMAATIAAISLIYCASAVLLTHYLAERLRASPRVGLWLERFAGSVLVAFGLKLAAGK